MYERWPVLDTLVCVERERERFIYSDIMHTKVYCNWATVDAQKFTVYRLSINLSGELSSVRVDFFILI